MSALNGLDPQSPMLPMSPLVRTQSFDWAALLRCQSVAATALDNHGLQLPRDLAAADQEQPIALQLAPQFSAAQQPQTSPDDLEADLVQGGDSPQEVKGEQIDGGESVANRTRKKSKTAAPPSEYRSEPLTKQERNRLAARKARKKKKLYVKKLEDENGSLEQRVKQLRQTLASAQGKVEKLTKQVVNLKKEREQRHC